MSTAESHPAPCRYHALCVGINRYEHVADNRFAVSDAQALHQSLRHHLGYRSRLLVPRQWLHMSQALDRLVQEAQPGDTVLVYVAAHGVELPRLPGDDEGLPRALLLFPQMRPADVRDKGEQAGEVLALRDLTRRLAQAAPAVNWVLVWDTCRSSPADLHLPDPGFEPQQDSSVSTRDLAPRRSHRPAHPQPAQPAPNWTVLLACRAGQKAHELGRLQRGALGYVLHRLLQEAHAAGQPLWADEALAHNLDLMLKAVMHLTEPSLVQRVDHFPTHPAPSLLPARSEPLPLPPTGPLTPCRPCKLLSLALGLLALIALLWLLWFTPKPPPPPPCPPDRPCPACPQCPPPPPPPCEPTDIRQCTVCDREHPERCAPVTLEIWDGQRKLFWALGKHDKAEWHEPDGRVASTRGADVWQEPGLLQRQSTGTVSMVVALGLASEELPKGLTDEEGQREEERRACRRAQTLLQGQPPSAPAPARALVLGKHMGEPSSSSTKHRQRPVALVSIGARHPDFSDQALAREIQHAISTRWSQQLGRYSLSQDATLKKVEDLRCGGP